jgi:hypothetical protein
MPYRGVSCHLYQKPTPERGEIIPALSQWRQGDRKDAEAVIQIAAKLASGDELL